ALRLARVRARRGGGLWSLDGPSETGNSEPDGPLAYRLPPVAAPPAHVRRRRSRRPAVNRQQRAVRPGGRATQSPLARTSGTNARTKCPQTWLRTSAPRRFRVPVAVVARHPSACPGSYSYYVVL